MMFGNVVCAILYIYITYNTNLRLAILLWSAILLGIVIFALKSWWRSRGNVSVERASRRAIKHAKANAFILGAWWGIGAAAIYLEVGSSDRAIVAAIVGGMICGGGFALSSLPSAMIAYLVPLVTGSAFTLFWSGELNDSFLAILLGVFAFIIYKSGTGHGRLLKTNFDDREKLSEQSSIIGLLLREFEEGTSDWLWETDQSGKLVRGGERFLQDLGFDINAADQVDDDLFDADGSMAGYTQNGLSAVQNKIASRRPFRDIAFSITHDHKTRWISISGKPVIDSFGAFAGFRGVASDITDAKEAEKRIAYLAHNDALTGLVNRSRFSEILEKMIENKAEFGENWCVTYLDLDDFKTINDHQGHAFGDQILTHVGARLKQVLRENDIVARLGGDEFAVICRSTTTMPMASALAERILEAFNAPFKIGQEQMAVGISIGIAFAGRDGNSSEELLNSADLALYRAKSEGKNRYCFFEVEMDEVIRERRSLEQDLRNALPGEEFELHYQPIIEGKTRLTNGFEALLRWQHPERGTVMPDEFISLAESIGLMNDIGSWVIRHACKTAMTWPDHLMVSVNLSPQQFKDGQVVDVVRNALQDTGLRPDRLELEITENLFIANTQEAIDSLRELKKLGISIALDDFGTGYSSLSYLLKFPFDRLKIDKSFIVSIKENLVAKNILETITRLGQILNLQITAEGVENEEQVEYLNRIACTQLQGYEFSKPISEFEIAAYLLREIPTGKIEDASQAGLRKAKSQPSSACNTSSA